MKQGWKIVTVVLVALALLLPAVPTTQATSPTGPALQPEAPNATVTFAVIGDYGMDDSNAAAVATMVSGWSPDFVVATGDDYYNPAGGSGDTKYDESTGGYYCTFLKGITTSGTRCATPGGSTGNNKFFPVLGNHDYSDAGTTPSGGDGLPTTYTNYFTLPGAGITSSNTSGNERYYDFVQGPVHFFMLNSGDGVSSSNCTTSEEPYGCNSSSVQATWLQTQLAASTSPWNIVVIHKPPFSSDTTHGSTSFTQWPYAAWGADAVLSGHAHDYERIVRDGIVYLVNGLGGAAKYNFGTPVTGSQVRYNANWGAQKVVATDTGITFEFWSVGPTEAPVLIDSYSLPQAPSSCTTVDFQQGAASYAGARDNYIRQNNPTFNYGVTTPLVVDSDDPAGGGLDNSALLYWDISSIPAGNTIQSASITINVTNATASPGYDLYDMAQAWVEGTQNGAAGTGATWNTYDGTNSWPGGAGGAGVGSRNTTVLGAAAPTATGSYNFSLNASGLAVLQSWVNTSANNKGFMLWAGTTTDGLGFDSKENATVANRPKLTITYCQPADIGDTVWSDTNGNGIQDGGEPGVAGVTVALRDSGTNALVQTTTTGGTGIYSFSGVPTGNYYVEFVAPATYGFSPKYATGATTPTGAINDSDANPITGRTDAFAWTAGGAAITSIDAGLITSCRTVSFQDGVSPTAGYAGTSDTWINSGSTGADNGALTTVTVNGDTPNQRALIKWDLAPASIPTGKHVIDASVTVNATAASAEFSYFYGMNQAWTESADWNTYNNSNNWPAGAGVNPNDRGTTLLAHLDPGAATGSRTFDLHAAGRQQIEGWLNTPASNQGFIIWRSNAADDFVFSSSEVTTASQRPKLTFTYCDQPDVGNEVWADLDADGVQDAGEPPAEGVTVNLWWVGPNGLVGGGDDMLVKTTQSVGGSSYGFWGLVSGATYYLEFIAPAGNSFSPQNVGPAATNSDADPNSGLTLPFVWTAPTQDLDAGLYGGPQCYTISDSTDTAKNDAAVDVLTRFDPLSGVGTYIGPATNGTFGNATNLESATWDPFSAKLYSVEDIQANANAYLVSLDVNTGGYTRVGGPLGTCLLRLRNGTSGGNLQISDVDGLGIDYVTGNMYATVRRSGPDALFQINPATGLAVSNAFPGGWGCVEIEYPSGDTSLTDIDDIGFNPIGVLYGAANLNQSDTRIVVIDKNNGNTTDLGPVYYDGAPLTDIEGFGFDETGRALATTGQDGDDGNDDSAYELDLTSNPVVAQRKLAEFNGYNVLLSSPASPPYVSYEDYEGLTCYGVSEGQAPAVLSAIGNYVWVDENNDGYQDAGEDGIPNVLVELWVPGNDGVFGTADDTVFATTYTDAQGGYLFDQLTAGPYQVRIPATNFNVGNALEGMTQTTNPVNGGDDFGNQTLAPNGNGTSGYTIVLGFADENLTADFGFNHQPNGNVNGNTGLGAIGDRVWVDVDPDGAGPLQPNGAQDPDEIGIPGLTVHLLTPGPDGLYGTGDDPLPVVTTTDANGNYLFNNLPAGSYKVVIPTPPAGWTQTGDPDHFGTTGANNDNQTTPPIILGPGDVFLNADFGYNPPADSTGSIGDHVWFDANGDGVDDGGANEYGIPGVTVALIRDLNENGQWDAGEPIVATDTTDASGNYLFTGLPVTDGVGTDDYLVWVNDSNNVLAALEPTYDDDGGTTTSSGAPLGVLTSTSLGISAVPNLTTVPVLDQDFGYTPRSDNDVTTTGLIGDTIFFDVDGNGSQGAGESGIEGVVVELYDSTGSVLLGTTTTDENGHYYFNNLNANNVQYTVKVAASNFTSGGVLEGMANTADPDGGFNSQSQVTLTPEAPINLAQDFGYQATTNPGSIGNLVWEDLNADGNVDAGENGIAGVTVDLYRDLNGNGRVDPGEPLFATTTTDGSGAYLFPNLPTADNGVGAAGSDWVVDVSDRAGVLAGYWHSLGTTGADNNSQIDPYAASISTAAPNNLTADFGYYVRPAALGNRVWLDDLSGTNSTDGNGIQDAGEPGISNVEVTLTITWPDNTTTVIKTLTDSTGYYSFGNLLLDEDYNGDGSGPEPSHTISIDLNQTALAGLYVTAINATGSTVYNDSDDPAGTAAQPVQGQTNTSFANDNAGIASYDFGFSTTPLAVLLATFDATAQTDHVLVAWETVSEVSNAGFNLYRSLAADGERSLLTSVPSAAPGSTAGAAYSYQDADVLAGQTYWYFLEDIDLSGATTLHGPVSVAFSAPTAVTLNEVSAGSQGSSLSLLWLAVVAGLAAAALTLRRRTNLR